MSILRDFHRITVELKMSTIIAFDYGLASIGIAIGQAITRTATPLKALKAVHGQPKWEEVKKILDEWKPDYLVVGLPIDVYGNEQEMSIRARKFANRLHGRFGYKVELKDERFTTTEAKSNIFAQAGYKALRKGSIDSESATLILEAWFESKIN